MYILRISVSNVRSIEALEWEIAPEQAAGWHVIIGDNGAGKSSLLRALALALNPESWGPLRLSEDEWLRRGAKEGRADATLLRDEALDPLIESPGSSAQAPYVVGFRLPTLAKSFGLLVSPRFRDRSRGWFAAAYGPFRRFSGGDPDYERSLSKDAPLARCLSIFDERVALGESLEWLQRLQYRSLEQRADSGVLEPLTEFINSEGFLPHGTRLHEISSDGVLFVDGNGATVPIQELSDGYRSLLSLTLDLLRHLVAAYGAEEVFDPERPGEVRVPGVVMIDEVDVHLHPTWQRTVGQFFRQRFPRMQFFVTSHSPLVCQAAEVGTVFQLPRPGETEPGRFVTGTDLARLVYGSILDAYGTGVFGSEVTRSERSTDLLRRLAELNRKELRGEIGDAERREQQEIRSILPSEAYETEPVPTS